MDRATFFDDGIRFQCQRCGGCCTGAPGVVRVTAAEAAMMAGAMGVSTAAFTRRFLYPFQAAYSIRETADGRCAFFEASGCRIYDQRPLQCRTWPFWLQNLRSAAQWEKTRRACPGIGRGPVIDRAAIMARLYEGMTHLPDAMPPEGFGVTSS